MNSKRKPLTLYLIMNFEKLTQMDNKLFKLLVKMQTQLLEITGNLLNHDNEFLEKVLVQNENGEFVEDKNHWNKMLLKMDKLLSLIFKLESRALAITEKSDIQILDRFLVDFFEFEFNILCHIEEKHLKSEDARTECLVRAVFSFNYIYEIIDNTEKQLGISSEPSDIPSKQLKTNLNDTQRGLLFDLLVKDKFIPDKMDRDGFIWAFGGKNDGYTSFNITWLKNKQVLRELLTRLKHKDIIQADFERLVPLVFIDKKDNPINLAKNKPVPSIESDTISEIHKKIATC